MGFRIRESVLPVTSKWGEGARVPKKLMGRTTGEKKKLYKEGSEREKPEATLEQGNKEKQMCMTRKARLLKNAARNQRW